MKSTFSDSPGNHNRWFRPHFSHFCATRLGRFINESRYGGILYLALWLVVLGLVFTLFQTIFLSIAYTGRLTPDDYEVLHVEQTEYDQSIGAYDSGIIRRFSDYLVTVQYEVDGTRYTADLSLGQAFFTGNRVARAGADGSSVLGTIFYKSSDPKRLKYIPARRHILPFSTGKYVCREDTDDFAAQVCALLQQEDYGSLAALSYNGRDIPVTVEDTEEYFHDDLVYFRKNVGDLSLLEGTTVYHDTPWATAVTIRYYSKEAQETYSDYLPITVKDGHYRLDLRWKY